MKEEEILALIAAPFIAGWMHRQDDRARRVHGALTLHDYSDARDRALYQARELLEHAKGAVHGPEK